VHASFEDPDVGPTGPPRATGADGVGQPLPPDGRTMVFAVPTIDAPLATMREIRPDGTVREVRLDGRPLTIGRASENGLVLRDSRASRFHGRLQARRGALVYTDLGSTNGSLVNGVPVTEVVLGEGDRIELGGTVLVVESVSVG
jgi:pSer/pThr/pTyr-binding forkhead associated (FHA) protein